MLGNSDTLDKLGMLGRLEIFQSHISNNEIQFTNLPIYTRVYMNFAINNNHVSRDRVLNKSVLK